MSKVKILFDEDCYLCQQTKSILQPLDWFRKMEWQPLQQFAEEYKISASSVRTLKKEIHVITHKNEVKRGFAALQYLLLRMPTLFTLGLLINIPGVSLIGHPLYKGIARNRYNIFKKQCINGSCSIS
ncbi:thiol-disulfide oxidoreductase DCC family protein [Halobacillus sp. Marseille-Q1614]|uniref:thiol-disulfide oxidoreductase DCC family protein n=1 Tax=Halobacillus sp. Marseille-Q1614 TaxID=2709134 RepID=UPI00156E0678|nr:DUF393 domain-containing protein [Halobacillus sp. Marseille-Q1614]